MKKDTVVSIDEPETTRMGRKSLVIATHTGYCPKILSSGLSHAVPSDSDLTDKITPCQTRKGRKALLSQNRPHRGLATKPIAILKG